MSRQSCWRGRSSQPGPASPDARSFDSRGTDLEIAALSPTVGGWAVACCYSQSSSRWLLAAAPAIRSRQNRRRLDQPSTAFVFSRRRRPRRVPSYLTPRVSLTGPAAAVFAAMSMEMAVLIASASAMHLRRPRAAGSCSLLRRERGCWRCGLLGSTRQPARRGLGTSGHQSHSLRRSCSSIRAGHRSSSPAITERRTHPSASLASSRANLPSFRSGRANT